MAKAVLPTNYKDDIMASSMAGKRRYNLIQNSDGTVSLEDVTNYTQVGSNFGAAQMNQTNTAVNNSADASKIINSLSDVAANTQSGMIAGALAVRELNSKITESGIGNGKWNSLTKEVVYKKKNGIVFVKGESFGTVSVPANIGEKILGRLPSEYRPGYLYQVPANVKAINTGYNASVAIETSGDIKITNLNPNSEISYWSFLLCYPV